MILTNKQAYALIDAVVNAERAGIQITVAKCEAAVWVYFSPASNLVQVVEFATAPSPMRPLPAKGRTERYDGWQGLETAYATAQEIPVGPTPTN